MTVYHMPRWLRKYTFHEIKKFFDKESDSLQNTGQGDQKSLIDSKGNIDKQQFSDVSNQYKGRTTYK